MSGNPLLAPAYEVEEACASEDPEVMFPDNESKHSPEVRAARAVCRRCPVREACLEKAIETRQPFGVWGGLTTREREALRRRGYRRGPRPAQKSGKPLAAPQHAPGGVWEDATLDFAV